MQHTLKTATEYRQAFKGTHARGSLLHIVLSTQSETTDARYGIITTKALGKAVLRNTVKRRLRTLILADALPQMTASQVLLVRPTAQAATATSEQLRAELQRLVQRAQRKQK